jgi:hypothetical protein
MTALVAVETVLLVLLVVLVAGLLRSHAEILRRLGQPRERDAALTPAGRVSPPPATTQRTGPQLRPAPLTGTTPQGDAIALAFDGAGSRTTLLAFLTSGCSTCAGFWETLAEPRLSAPVQIVIVAHGAERERPARLRELAPDGIPVVMASEAWEEYRVPGAPYFVLVDGVVRGEGVATTWQALASLVSDAIEDQQEAGFLDAGPGRARRVDDTLAVAGIGPDDPSLYPGRGASGGDR